MTDYSKKGWVRLHRKIEENPLYFLEPFTKCQAWIDLFLNANHTKKTISIRGNIIKIERGQIAWSETTMASRWMWSRKKVRNFLKWLKSEQQIEQQVLHRITTITTILNYEDHQKDTTECTTEELQKNNRGYTTKKEKNVKNEKKKKSERKTSKAFGEEAVVFLIDEEYKKLATKFGGRNVDRFINNMQNWKLQSTANMNKYTNDYRALLNWIARASDDGKFKISWEDFREDDFESPEDYQNIINKYS